MAVVTRKFISILAFIATFIFLLSAATWHYKPDLKLPSLKNLGDNLGDDLGEIKEIKEIEEERGPKPRYIFVDLGANAADSLEAFLGVEGARFQYDFPRPEWATHREAEIFLFEANPVFNEALLDAKQRYSEQHIPVTIFPSTVADVRDGTRTFYLDLVNEANSFWGSSVFASHPDVQKSHSNGTELTAMNIARWLLMNTLPRDFVVVKMDIEGSEYELIPHFAEMGVWKVIDYLLVEWHTGLPDEATQKLGGDAARFLESKGVQLPQYNSPA
ncbi:hypothetical protein HYFRA_00007106 [Hymenoscyphus fraxineus]|uniref:Methyltransferase FkbM domain-containing protein n=1 Tax=Hymenoscyphus fraxineus TaxID=746836 RepID=A0A9N9KWE4_9HELO|nr:hypothetical protein HYFRA_00007106 [Hymenoscyphus fraxineus]